MEVTKLKELLKSSMHSIWSSLNISWLESVGGINSKAIKLLAGSAGLYVLYKLCDGLLRLPRVGRYSDRYILVTGCGSGFGLDLVKRLDSLGCHVFAGCRTESSVAHLTSCCSDRVLPILMDVTKPDSVRKALQIVSNKLREDGKELWAVVNNAGTICGAGPVEWITIDDIRASNDVNLYGMIDVTMTFLPLIKKSRGRVVIMSSIAGRLVGPGFCPYSVSKYGVEAFSDELRRSMRPYKGLKVSILEPGFFKTNVNSYETFTTNIDKSWKAASAEIRQEFGEHYYKTLREALPKHIGKKASTRISDVVDAYEHAIFSRRPRARYVIGRDARLEYRPVMWLPEWLADWLIELVYFKTPQRAALVQTNRLSF